MYLISLGTQPGRLHVRLEGERQGSELGRQVFMFSLSVKSKSDHWPGTHSVLQ